MTRQRARIEFPWDVSFAEWRVVARDVSRRISQDHVSLTAAALAFYGLLAIFPTLIALVGVTRLVVEPSTLERVVNFVSRLIPPSGREVLHTELHALLAQHTSGVSFGLVASVLTALWSASSGVDSLLLAVDLAYEAKDTKTALRRRATSFAVTIGLVVFLALVLALTAVVPGLIRALSPRPLLFTISLFRWPVMFGLFVVFLMVLYRFAAGGQRPMRWNVSGPLVGTIGWLLISAGFSFYVSTLASYDRTYGALGGVVVLVFWLYLSSFVVLVGAEVNARLERGGEEKRASLRTPSEADASCSG